MTETIAKVTTIVTKFAKNRAALADITPDTRFREDLAALEPYRKHIALETLERPLRYVMTNNFGFGNTNGSMILERVDA